MEGRFCKLCGSSDVIPRTESERLGTARLVCFKCMNARRREIYQYYKQNSYFKYKATRTKSRAQSIHVPFDLDEMYLKEIWTDTCPVFNIPLETTAPKGHPNSPELDRLDPTKGYVRGNVCFLSHRANRIKDDATLEDIERLYKWLQLNSSQSK